MDLWNRFRGGPQEVLRWGAEESMPWRERLRSPRTLMQLGLVAGLVVCLVLVIQLPRARLPVPKGQKAVNPILSRVYFEEENPELTGVVQALVGLQQVPRLYKPNDHAAVLKEQLKSLIDEVAKAPDGQPLPDALRRAWPLPDESLAAIVAHVKKTLAEKAAAEKPAATDTAAEKQPQAAPVIDPREQLKAEVAAAMDVLARPENLPVVSEEEYKNLGAWLKRIEELQSKLPARLFPKDDPLLQEPAPVIGLLLPQTKEGEYQPLPMKEVLWQRPAGQEEVRARVVALAGPALASVFGEACQKALLPVIVGRLGPTLVYDQSETEKRRSAAARDVKPFRNKYEPNATLVEAGKEITEPDLKLLEKEQQAYLRSLGLWRILLTWLGAAVIVGLLVVMLAADTLRLQPSVGRSFPRTLMLTLLVLAVVAASKIALQVRGPEELCTFFLVVAAMVVTIAYSQVFALAMAGSTIFLVAIATQADLDWAITAAVGTSVAILALGEINNRTVLVRVGALAGLGFFLAKAALGFWRPEDAGSVLRSAALYFGVGLGAGVVLLALLPYIERVFGIVTNISLLELCDVNQPALRRLALEAPGTYTHSLLIGSLAEAACEAIGANGLLARVGAYFHDIGKAAKPHYFIENWEEGENGHAGLTPETSSQVIMNHVKDGLEMAGRVGLPPILKQFIAEHHGTTQMVYFYREAVRRQKAEGGPVPRESDYRYPGSKPRSRETALVMLADAVEGATRSQDDRSAAKIAETVHQILMSRLLDGQLDRSGLTLTDLHTAEETLTKTLLSVYHGRVPYPTGHRTGEPPIPPAKDKSATGGGPASAGPTR